MPEFSRKNQAVDQPLRKSSFDLEGLLACARGELFGPGNPQLPLPPMLMFDRITSITEDGGEDGKGQVVAEALRLRNAVGDLSPLEQARLALALRTLADHFAPRRPRSAA